MESDVVRMPGGGRYSCDSDDADKHTKGTPKHRSRQGESKTVAETADQNSDGTEESKRKLDWHQYIGPRIRQCVRKRNTSYAASADVYDEG